MDAFTYIVDMFTITPSDDEDLPKNEENPSGGIGGYPVACVIAWDT